MSRINQVEDGLRQIEAGKFQKLATEYLYKEYGLKHISAYGSQAGTDKTIIGIPDAFSCENDGFVLIAYTTNQTDTVNKIKGDIGDCLTKASVPDHEIQKIFCCHTNFRLNPKDYRELQALDERIEVVPPSQMALDLVGKYPVLAHEYFDTALGSGAFKTCDEYLEAQKQSRYSTDQSRNIMYRDCEIENLVGRLVNGARAVVVEGPSGCGKTKLALDACSQYCKESGKDLLLLESRNAKHADADIGTVIKEADNLVIIIDDANQQTALDYLLDVVASKDDIAIVATVRSSFARELKAKIGRHLSPTTLSLEPLDEDKILSVIRNEYGIVDYFATRRIASIAHGNLRLAIMAAAGLAGGDPGSFMSPYDMLNAYIEPRLKDYSHSMVMALEAFAVWGVCDVVSTDEACLYLSSKGVDVDEVHQYAIELNDDEVVDTLSDGQGVLAIRFQEQNLRDYLVYRAFMVDKALSLASFIVDNILDNRNRVTTVCGVLLDVFADDKAIETVKGAALSALKIAEGNDELTQALMFDFQAFYGALALEYARSAMEAKPPRDISKEIGSRNSSSDASVVLRILATALRRPQDSEIAAELIVECVSRGGEAPDEYRWFFSRNNALTPMSLEEDFRQEILLLNSLSDAYGKTKGDNIARCLLMLVKTLLQGSGETAAFLGPASVQFSYFQVPCCAQRAKLDYECFKALRPMLDHEWLSKEVWHIFRHHFGWHDDCPPNSERMEMLGQELSLLSDILLDFIVGTGLDEYNCCVQLNEICTKAGVPPIDAAVMFDDAVIDAWSICLDSAEVEGAIQDWPLERIASACEAIAAIPDDGDLAWSSREVVPRVMSFLVDSGNPFDRCWRVLRRYLEKSDECRTLHFPRGLFDQIVSSFGYQLVRNEIESAALDYVKTAAIDIVDYIGIVGHSEEVDCNKLLGMLDDGELHLDFLIASKAAGCKYEFLYEYTTRSLINISDRSWLIERYFRPVSADDWNLCLQSLSAAFFEKEKELADWYVLFLQERHFDYDGLIALFLFDRCEDFASDFVAALHGRGLTRWSDAAGRIGHMWAEEYVEMPAIMSQLVTCFYSNENMRGNPIAAFLPIRSLKIGAMQQCWDWLFNYIDEMIGDVAKMQDVVEAFGDAGDPERLAIFSHVLAADVDGNLIRNIWLGRTSMSGSIGEGFSQAYRCEASFLRQLSASLPKKTAYLSHRAWLEQCAEHEEDMANEELWKGFHEV